MKMVYILLYGFLFFLFSSCETEAESVLNMTAGEAAQSLKKGDIAFILEASPLKMRELSRIHQNAPFYAGLLAKDQEPAPNLRTIRLFETALDAPSNLVRENAAFELTAFMAEGGEPPERILSLLEKMKKIEKAKNFEKAQKSNVETLKAVLLYRLGEFGEAEETAPVDGGAWADAVSLLSALKIRRVPSRKVLDFFLSETIEKAHQWAYREIADMALLSHREDSAVEGHFLTAKKAYRDALKRFRVVIEGDYTFFFKNPALIADLGRCFQYAGASAEGSRLFIEWEQLIGKGVQTKKEFENAASARYNLLFYAGRMERQLSHWKEADDYFQNALIFAPDEKQEDACIWYILNTAFKVNAEETIRLLPIYASLWHEKDYFSDILSELCQNLAANRKWTKLLEVFALTRQGRYADETILAKYAYILGRAVSEGYIPQAEAAAYTGLDGSERSFFRAVFEEPKASFYYRALSAFYLGENVAFAFPDDDEKTKKRRKKEKYPNADAMDFLLGFFEYGAARYAVPFIERLKEGLTIPELRVVAAGLEDCGQWYEAIRLISSYMERADYALDYSDMLLFYPRPFYDIIQKYAEKARISEALLFGLIRTESAFMAEAVSSARAVGLSQLMETTAREMAEYIRKEGEIDYFESGFKIDDPEANVHIGSYYFRYLIDRADNIMFAVLGYNGGPNRIKRLRNEAFSLPDDLFLETVAITETREYGKRVSAAAAVYGYLYYNVSMEKTFADIYNKKRVP
jgi:soluble lytic murein transglycosylase